MSIIPYNNFTVIDLSNVVQPYLNSSTEFGYFSSGSLVIPASRWYSLPVTLNTNNGIARLDASGGLRILQPGIYSINLSLFPTTTQSGSSNISFNFGTRFLSNVLTTSSTSAFGGELSTGMFTYDPSNNGYIPGIISWLADGYNSNNSTISNFVTNSITNELSYNYFNAGYTNGTLYKGICTTEIKFILDSSATIFLNVSTSSTSGVIMGRSFFTLNLINYLPVFPFPPYVPPVPPVPTTWNFQKSTNFARACGCVAASSDGSKVFVGTNGTTTSDGIFYSSDYGATWSSTPFSNSNKGNWRSLASNIESTNIVGGLNGGGIFYSSGPNYTTWTPATGAPSGPSYRAIVSSNEGAKLAAVNYGNYIYISTDYGRSWLPKKNDIVRNWIGIASDDTCTKLAAVNYGEYIYLSVDSGNTWLERTGAGARNWQCITSDDTGQYLAAGINLGSDPNSGIYYSTNSGADWTRSDAPSANWIKIVSSSDGSKLLAVINGGLIYASSNYGVNWSSSTPNIFGNFSANWQDVVLSFNGLRAVAVNNASTSDAVYRGTYT